MGGRDDFFAKLWAALCLALDAALPVTACAFNR